jgi:hypothetical protein
LCILLGIHLSLGEQLISQHQSCNSSVAVSWTASTITDADLAKVKEEGFLAASAEITFSGIEVVPHPQSGYQIMFLIFFLCGHSLLVHEFLRGLLFVYAVQLHQLTPNSILHIACFITLCEAFLGINPD